jgi:uncharacterized protein YdaU (DUF1376 family)
MQYYSFHIGDYTTSTVHLSPLEDLTYRRLIDFYYMKEEPIPLDTHWVSRRLRVDTEDVENILQEFFVETEDGWRNERCDDDISKYQAMANRNKANGARGGRPKKNPEKPTGLRVATESKPTGKPTINQEPLTKNQEPKSNTSGYTAEFENFWKEYQRKGSKANAFKRWKKLSADHKSDAVEAIQHYFVENPDMQYRKDAEGYLSGKLFESTLERVNNNQLQLFDSSNDGEPQQAEHTGITMNPAYLSDLSAGIVSNPQEWIELKAKERGEQ